MNWRWTPRQWAILCGILLVSMVVIYSSISQLGDAWEHVRTERELREQFQNQATGLEVMQYRVDSLRQYRKQLEQHRPGVRNQPQILSQIHRIASEVHIREIQSLAPTGQDRSEHIQVHTFTIRVQDDYPTILTFLNRLERATPPFYIESLELRTGRNTDQEALQSEITAAQAGELRTS